MVAHCIAALLYFSVIQGELAHDPAVRDALWKLLADAHYGFARTEEAMFIVRNLDGSVSFLRWDSLQQRHQARWSAPIPRGVVAIAHTHPNWMPEPSPTDMRTARRSRLPVYVVTRTQITKTIGGDSLQVAKGAWR